MSFPFALTASRMRTPLPTRATASRRFPRRGNRDGLCAVAARGALEKLFGYLNGLHGGGNRSAVGILEIVSASSEAMWMNCDDVQHAVQPLHGTSESRSWRKAACIPPSHDAKSPAARSSPSASFTD